MPDRPARPSARDYQAGLELVGAVHELLDAGQPAEARRELLRSVQELLRLAAVFWTVLDSDLTTSSAPDPSGVVRTDIAGLDDWQLALWQKPFFDDGGFVENPLWEVLQPGHGRLRTVRRADVIPAERWRAHPQHQFARALGFDDEVASMVPIGEGRECLLVVSRAYGDRRRFGHRERLLVHAVQGALRSFYRRLLEPPTDLAGRPRLPGLRVRLAPRHRAVLDQLLTGRSEKEIAAVLGLSPRTVHKYVETVFDAAHVSSRAELMALFIPPGQDGPA